MQVTSAISEEVLDLSEESAPLGELVQIGGGPSTIGGGPLGGGGGPNRRWIRRLLEAHPLVHLLEGVGGGIGTIGGALGANSIGSTC